MTFSFISILSVSCSCSPFNCQNVVPWGKRWFKNNTTKPKSDQSINNNQQPSNDKNKQSTNNNTGKQDKNELSTNKTSDTKTGKQNSDNTLSQEKQQTTSTSTTKQEDNKNNDKKTLPNTGESRSTLGIIGTVLSITGLGFIVKRKRG